MGLLDVHAEGIGASIQRQLRDPDAEPEPVAFSTLSFFGAALGGAPRAALETAASASDLITKETGPNAPGTVMRRKANEWAPPETAHAADQVIGGLTRFATKAVVDVATLGPVAGAAALALDEGNTVTQNLRTQGVDTATAAKVGAVTGVLSGVGAVLPVAGSTVARTMGLVVAGGPASFVAQEAASREILQRAGHAEEAAKHDPLDPLSLALSVVVPGAFGAFHARNLRRVQRLADLKTESDARTAAALTPKEQAHSDAFERSDANLRELEAAIAREKNPETRAILQEEFAKQSGLAKKLGQERLDVAAQEVPVVDAARVRVDADALARSLPDHPQAHGELMRAADAVAAGDQVDVLPLVWEPPPAARLAREVEGGAIYQIVDESGDAVGSISTRDMSTARANGDGFQPVMQIYNAGIDVPEAMGKGLGIRAYTQVVDEALADGKQVWSDTSVTPDAQRLYDSLERRGYKVERNPSRPPTLEDDGTLTTRGSFVYRVTKGPDAPAARTPGGERDAPAASFRPSSSIPDQASPTVEPARAARAPAGEKGDTPTVDTAAIQRLTAENPDMPVLLPGSDQVTTLAKALEAARATAKEEAAEADLFKAALDCALSFGA